MPHVEKRNEVEMRIYAAAARPLYKNPGLTLLFTGLPSSGKSTLSSLLRARIESLGRAVTLLDGDQARMNLSSELGFSREHRDLNVSRIAYVASEITRHGGVAICSLIAPYDAARKGMRALVERAGNFVLVYISTPLGICEGRDPKGLYAKARAGIIPLFTGVSDPYEPPADADITLDTSEMSAERGAGLVMALLQRRGYIAYSAID